MTQTHPPRQRYGPPTLHSSQRRRITLLFTVLTVSAVVFGLLGVGLVRWAHGGDARREYLSSDGWPTTGQGAYRVGSQPAAASANEHPAPIASLAKVMTALVVLRAHPLPSGSDGFTLTVSAADAADTEQRRRRDESLVPVEEGERLTERQALMALLLPSANNVAIMLARAVAGTVPAFVAKMNRAADGLGMHDTTYTDPSGFDSRTVSTATDQLILAEDVARDPVLSAMMATGSYSLPVAGTVHNTDTLLGSNGFVGMKTGSDDAAGGCFMFHVRRDSGGHVVDLVGVVLGQSGHNLVTAGLTAAKQLADRLLPP